MILWRSSGNFAKNSFYSGLLLRFHGYGGVHVMCISLRVDCLVASENRNYSMASIASLLMATDENLLLKRICLAYHFPFECFHCS